MEEIINRVASSQLVTVDLEEFYTPGDRVLFDLKDLLFEGLILKEKDFRNFIRDHDWTTYGHKLVAICCTADAVVPTWAFMLLDVALRPHAEKVVYGSLADLESQLFYERIQNFDWQQFKGAKVVVKGCSKVNVPVSAYVEAVNHLQPIVSSLMFGEACSTVPLFKRKG